MPNKSFGFTLIELMVAISIVAILATVGFSSYQKAQGTARDNKRISDVQEIQKALEQFYSKFNHYPCPAAYDFTTGSFIPGAGSGISGPCATAAATESILPYFQNNSFPQDPVNDSTSGYQYGYYWGCSTGGTTAAPQRYMVCAKLESCGSKCNVSAASFKAPTNNTSVDACSFSIGAQASGNAYYCAGSLSSQ